LQSVQRPAAIAFTNSEKACNMQMILKITRGYRKSLRDIPIRYGKSLLPGKVGQTRKFTRFVINQQAVYEFL